MAPSDNSFSPQQELDGFPERLGTAPAKSLGTWSVVSRRRQPVTMIPTKVQVDPRASKRSLLTLSAFAFVLIFQLFVSLPAMDAPGIILDEGAVLYYPELIAKGLVPQQDFESMYPPGNLWFLSSVYTVFGTSIQVERTCGLLYQIALVSAFFVLLSRWSLTIAVSGSILCIFSLLPINLVAFAWTGASALALWALVAVSARGRPEFRGGLAGALAALALSWRADLAPALILSLAGYCIFARWKIRPILWLVGSAMIALLPLLSHIIAVSPNTFLSNIFLKPVLLCNPARKLPLDFSRALVGQLYTLLGISTGLALLAGWRVYRSSTDKNPTLLAAGLLCLGAFPQALQRPDVIHLSFLTPLALPLLAVSASVIISRHMLSPILSVLSVFLLVPQSTGALRERLTGKSYPAGSIFTLHSGERTFPVANPVYAKASQDVITRLTEISKPGETLFVGLNDMRFAIGNDLFLYHMLPWLSPGSYYIELNPLSANRTGSGLEKQVAETDWLVLSNLWSAFLEPNASTVAGPSEPNEVVRDRFDLVFSKPPFEIYRRRSLVTHASPVPMRTEP